MNKEEHIDKAKVLAEKWLNESQHHVTSHEKEFKAKVKKMLSHPEDKLLLLHLMDQSFRPESSARISDQITYLLEKYGIAGFFGEGEKMLVRLFLIFGKYFPSVAIPQIIQRIREQTEHVIIGGEKAPLYRFLNKCKKEKIRANLNILGEAILGEAEAKKRLDRYIEALEDPEVAYISVKISSIYSQVHVLAFEETVKALSERLTILYRAAMANLYKQQDGRKVPKFVNLDMEEYRDLALTVKAFQYTLDKPEFKHHYAGLVLQAYLPDAYAWQQTLTQWAIERVNQGGSPIKIRLVKGANMEMELLEASIRDWPLATFDHKTDTDANFKRMVAYAFDPNHTPHVHIGLASHNLFDVAYAKILATEHNVMPYVTFEMLEGMSDSIRKVISKEHDMLVYAPVAAKADFVNAIAYLVRRLDENTAPNNFLRHSFHLTPHSSSWNFLADQFAMSFDAIPHLSLEANRKQNRLTESFSLEAGSFTTGKFKK